MLDRQEIIDNFRVSPGKKVRLKDYDPGWEGDGDLPKAERKEIRREGPDPRRLGAWPKPRRCSMPTTPGRCW